MNNLESFIDWLLEQETASRGQKDYFFTVYLPVKNDTKLSVKKKLKSQILTTFKNNQALKKYPQIRQVLIKQVVKKINQLPDLKKGVALLVKLKTEKQPTEKLKEFLNKNLTLVALAQTPKKEKYLGRTFDLDQLLGIKETLPRGLVINLNQSQANFYSLSGQDFKKEASLKNKFGPKKEDEYVEKFAPRPSLKIFHATGSENIARTEIKENELFLNQILAFLKKKTKSKKFLKPEYLLVFYSAGFKNLIRSFFENLKKTFPTAVCLGLSLNLQTKNRLKKEAQKLIKNNQTKTKRKWLKKARENFRLYAESWEAVCKAGRHKKIERLFIGPKAKKEGYLQAGKLIFTKPTKNARKVKNLAPWLVKNVAQAGGQVVVLNQKKLLPKSGVAAKLRY